MPANAHHNLVYPLRLISWCSLIYYLSSQPVHIPGPSFPFKDKLLHAAAFAVMALLAAKSFEQFTGNSSRAILSALLFVALFGAIDEWHQSMTPGRIPSMGDWLADAVGALVALSLLRPRLAAVATPAPGRDRRP